MRIILVGSGGVAYFLCRALDAKGHRVCFVNRDAAECAAFARRLRTTVVNGDATRVSVLEDAGIRECDAVMALTSRDDVNLTICQIALIQYGIQRVFALVNDPDNEPLFRLLGIEETFSVTPVISRLIEQRATFDSVLNLFPAALGKIDVSEIVLEERAPCVGVPLRDLHLPKDALIAGISRGTDVLVPNGDSTLEADDRVLLVSSVDSFEVALSALTGKV